VARLLPGLKTLLHTLSLRGADPGVVGVIGVDGVAGLAGIDVDLKNLLDPSPSASNTTQKSTHIYNKYTITMHTTFNDIYTKLYIYYLPWTFKGLAVIFLSLPRPRSG
jgi:hypothetical protein